MSSAADNLENCHLETSEVYKMCKAFVGVLCMNESKRSWLACVNWSW